jgi:hypothetical protein
VDASAEGGRVERRLDRITLAARHAGEAQEAVAPQGAVDQERRVARRGPAAAPELGRGAGDRGGWRGERDAERQIGGERPAVGVGVDRHPGDGVGEEHERVGGHDAPVAHRRYGREGAGESAVVVDGERDAEPLGDAVRVDGQVGHGVRR